MVNGKIKNSGNEKLLPFKMGYLTSFFKRKAETELNETPQNRENGLKMMREMVKKDEHFNDINIDDDFIIQYLRCKKFNIARAFSQLKSFSNFRKKRSEMFTNIEFEKMSILSRDGIATFLPYRCPDGCAIFLVELDKWDPETFPIEEVRRCVVLLLGQSLRDPMTQVNGYKVIINQKTSNMFRKLRYCTPSNLHMLYHGTTDCTAGRFKAIHLVNQTSLLKVGWMMIKNILSDKFKNRIIFHSGPESLLDYFPRDVLPVKYGGDLENYDMTDWLRKVTQPEMLATLPGVQQVDLRKE